MIAMRSEDPVQYYLVVRVVNGAVHQIVSPAVVSVLSCRELSAARGANCGRGIVFSRLFG